MSSLQTGHLVRNYAAYVGEERQVQGMELLDGTLWDHLDRSPTPLPIDEVVSLAMDIGIGIWQLHTRGIVHRDIKPENILTWQDSSGNVHAKISDFDIARGIPEDHLMTCVGTPACTFAYLFLFTFLYVCLFIFFLFY